MSKRNARKPLRWIIALLVCWSISASADTLVGGVVGVSDGDTVTVLDAERQQHKVRLGGIDAPEKRQAFGQRSKQALSDMVFGRTISVEWSKRDRYGRIVGKILVDAKDVNLGQVQSGFAWWYQKYASEQAASDQRLYAQAEDEAKRERRGLWGEAEPMAPWDFRRQKSAGGEVQHDVQGMQAPFAFPRRAHAWWSVPLAPSLRWTEL